MSQAAHEVLSIHRQPGPDRPTTDSAWESLERFIHLLEVAWQPSDHYRAALQAICEATGAQAAFLYADQVGRVIESVGLRAPAVGWCRALGQRLLAEVPGGGVWQEVGSNSDFVSPDGREPVSAAWMAIDNPKPACLATVSFDRTQPLDASHLRIMRVFWRIQMSQSRHALVYDNLKETLFGIVRCLSTAIDAKDSFTCGHSERVARIAVRLGEEMKLPRGEISDLYLAGLLHDVGKIGIRDDVLLKAGPLTNEEYNHIKEHPVMGERIIANVSRLAYLRPAVRGHHERYDGRGYPDSLAGENIPLMARIMAVADSCDAMMSARRYRSAIPPAKLEQIMREGAGTQWDPKIVDVFFGCRHELYAVCQRGLGQSVYMAIERAAGGGLSENVLSRHG